MSRLEAFLMIGIDELPLTKYYILDYSNQNSFTELLIIENSFKNCRKGSLQHKNKIVQIQIKF